jgi:hypothetical protein
MPTKGVLIARILTSAPNAKQKKTTKTAQHKDVTFQVFHLEGSLPPRMKEGWI